MMWHNGQQLSSSKFIDFLSTAMSIQVPKPAKSTSAPPDSHKFRFPPFPEVPAGVTITAFKDFKEHGIQVFETEDDIEKDGLGIPTIPLRTKHDTDFSKTNPNRKRKTAKEMAAARGPGFRKQWWEDWEEGEDLRNHGPYNSNVAAVDRLHQAASDFQKYRKFPPMITNVQFLWDQFRIFAGLLGTTPVWQKASEKPAEDADAELSDDDFDDGDSKSKTANPGERRCPARLRPRAPYDLYGKTPTIVDDNDDIKKLLDAARATKEDKVVDFLNDPARAIQVFLSSYMKYQGFLYNERNLVSAPHLLRFFVQYLLRNQVLPDRTTERSLRAALETIDAAGKELPITAKLAKLLPDDFSMACQGCWGRRVDGLEVPLEGLDDAVNPDAAFESALQEENVVVIKQEDILGADPAVALDPAVASGADTPDMPTPLAEVSVLVSEEGGPMLAIEPVFPENADIAQEDDLPAAAPAADTSDVPVPAPAADAPPTDEHDAFDPSSFTPPADPAAVWEQNNVSPETYWAAPARASLLSLLGPTALPLTHTPGIVEWSVRRIKSITPPAPAILAPKLPAAAATDLKGAPAPDPEAVERALEACLFRIVLAPWTDWETPEHGAARIMRGSVGALAVPGEEATPPPGPGGLKPHDMLKDEITLLADPSVVGELSVGMGLGGTWVQLARMADVAPVARDREAEGSAKDVVAAGNPKFKKKKALTKAQKERRALRLWYLEEHLLVLPSYWTL
ncbi:hypothetical protein C8R47DRAFT_1131733 [Mycena vitilis]|nr:hypothetical protein C8R47DRAFT_1131733 [Mycena vitilis]